MACVREKRLEMVFLDGFVCKTLVESTLGFILIHQLDYFSYCWVSCFGSAGWIHHQNNPFSLIVAQGFHK